MKLVTAPPSRRVRMLSPCNYFRGRSARWYIGLRFFSVLLLEQANRVTIEPILALIFVAGMAQGGSRAMGRSTEAPESFDLPGTGALHAVRNNYRWLLRKLREYAPRRSPGHTCQMRPRVNICSRVLGRYRTKMNFLLNRCVARASLPLGVACSGLAADVDGTGPAVA